MIEFETHSDCQLCPLLQTAKHPGIPTRSYDGAEILHRRAILFVGQSPGFNEDQEGKSFIGYTGGLLDKFIAGSHLQDYCDIYLANACRCKPPQGANESQSQIRACRVHLAEDIAKLQATYREVIIVVLGAKACYSVVNINSISKAFKKQGMDAILFPAEDKKCPKVFFTYHPANLHPSRKPALVRVVQTHFELLLRYITGEFIPNELKVTPLVGYLVPDILPEHVTLDIETYGILAGKEQTVFNPHKSKYVDGIDYKDQIVTVSFAWKDENNKIQTALYKWNASGHRHVIREWFKKISHNGVTLVGQNVKFDLMYLSASGDKELQYWIQPERLIVDDVMLLGFLLFEQQPEKGLKELAALYGIADYSELKVTGSSGNAKSSNDKDLHYYNCLDAAVTLVLREELLRRIEEHFGKDSPKLGQVCQWMRNIVIWDTFDLELNGSSIDINKLQTFHDSEKFRYEEIKRACEIDYGLKIAGKDSDAPLRDFMFECIQKANLLDDKRVEWTKTKKISIGVENVNLVNKYLPECKEREILSLYQEYKEKSKIVSTYTMPLLEEPRRGIVCRENGIGMIYPNWYPIPSYHERGGETEDKQGGQIQGRFSCKQPARQTEPRSVRNCSCSRWPDGKLVEYDVSQDHLRMAALLSGDPFLMGAYLNPSVSIHTQTAMAIYPEINPDSFPSTKEWKNSKEYMLGKTLNFLVLFKGGAEAFQRTALQDANIEINLDFCRQAITRWYLKYHVYKDWQDKMIALATRQGYLVLPTGWSRTFGPPGTNLSAFEGEILNFLHQTPCAQMLQTCHYEALRRFRKYYLRSVVCLQIYDAQFVDIYHGEESNVDEIMDEVMTRPPLLPILEQWVGRSIPWAYEKREYIK